MANSLKQACTSMILKQLRVADVTPECVHAFVARLIGHFEDARAPRSRRGQKARPKGMTTESRNIQPKFRSKGFHGAGDLLVGKPAVHDFATLGHLSFPKIPSS